jgi:lysine biosynthesis protein LysW
MVKANGKTKITTVYCRACHARIPFEEQPELFDIVVCPECEEEFEVVDLSPLQLDWPSDLLGDDEWAIDKDDDDPFDT